MTFSRACSVVNGFMMQSTFHMWLSSYFLNEAELPLEELAGLRLVTPAHSEGRDLEFFRVRDGRTR